MSSQSQDTMQDSNGFQITLQYACCHEHIPRPDDEFIPLPHVMKAWVDNFTYHVYTSASLAEANKPPHLDHGNNFIAKEFKSLLVLKSDFHILDLKKQCTQSEVNMLSEAILCITEFHCNDDGWASETAEMDGSDLSDARFDDWMSTSSTSSSSWSLPYSDL
ncbi:uncharacterized protein BJ212DRAFT_1483147 [Suillus subaureus]|uniref:Uncharacterized protein n=1 Tax=Suillus subaureus TaxID=48587 RepID=A0A9P7E6I4_9AGAM|nr:uncharacterized protein BJ212DRAFT_1483147 [Suillus subaureus]KAG1812536.1 hypothetical protein BJ212DRAFT_1483147 [Suillus subaureus]